MTYEDGVVYKFNAFAPHWVATAGVMNFVEDNKCYWLLDVLASYNIELKQRNADYLKICKFDLALEGGKGTFTIEDEINGLMITQHIPFTDLTQSVKIWAIDQGDNVIVMLPEEY